MATIARAHISCASSSDAVIMLCRAHKFASEAVQQRVGPSCEASPEVHVDESERSDGHHNCSYI
jgi:hypothetical protein